MVEDEDYFYDLIDEGNRRRVPSSANKEMGEAEDALEQNPLEVENQSTEGQSNLVDSSGSAPLEQQLESTTILMPKTLTSEKAPSAKMSESDRSHKLKADKRNTSIVHLEPSIFDAMDNHGGRPIRSKKYSKRYGIDDEKHQQY